MKKLLIDGGATSTKTYIIESEIILETKSFDYLSIQMKEKHSLSVLKQIGEYYKNHQISNVYLGCPGIHQYKSCNKIIQSLGNFDESSIEIMTDIEIQDILYTKGIVSSHYLMSLGSGTVLLEVIDNSKRFINSFGPFFGDDGSAFNFAKLFIRQAIMDYDKIDYDSKYILLTLEGLGFKNVEDIKNIYSDWNEVRNKLLGFAKFIMIDNYVNNENIINKIFEMNAENLISYLHYINLNKNLPLYLVGGMVKNLHYKNYLMNRLSKVGFSKIIFK